MVQKCVPFFLYTLVTEVQWRWKNMRDCFHCSACRRNLITGLTSAASPRVHISSTCKVGQKLGEIFYLLICSFLPCLSWLLRSRVRKSRRDLWITLYTQRHRRITVHWNFTCVLLNHSLFQPVRFPEYHELIWVRMPRYWYLVIDSIN